MIMLSYTVNMVNCTEGRVNQRFMQINESIVESISFEFISGVSKRHFDAHYTEWRRFPYAVIVCVFDSPYICETENEDVHIIEAGQVLFVPGGTRHRMTFETEGNLNCLHFKFTALKSIDILSFYEVPRVIKSRTAGTVCRAVEEIAVLQDNDNFTVRELIERRSRQMSLLDSLLSVAVEKDEAAMQLDKVNVLLPVLDFIRENPGSEITRKKLAGMISLSETRFHYVFKNVMGVSPMKYLQEERLKTAYVGIATTRIPLGEIAYESGFHDYSNFSRQFRAHFGKSPMDVRNSSPIGLEKYIDIRNQGG